MNFDYQQRCMHLPSPGCPHSARRRFMFDDSSLSCAHCAIERFGCFSGRDLAIDENVEGALRILDSLPKLLDVVSNFPQEELAVLLVRKLLDFFLSPLLYRSYGDNLDSSIFSSFDLGSVYVKEVPSSIFMTALDGECEHLVMSCCKVLKCSNQWKQIIQCVEVMLFSIKFPQFVSLCCAEDEIWTLLCCILYCAHSASEMGPSFRKDLIRVFLIISGSVLPTCQKLLNPTSPIWRDTRYEDAILIEFIAPVAEFCISFLCSEKLVDPMDNISCLYEPEKSPNEYSARRTIMLVLHSLLQYLCCSFFGKKSNYNGESTKAVQRLCRFLCKNSDNILKALDICIHPLHYNGTQKKGTNFSDEIFQSKSPAIGLSVLVFVLSLAQHVEKADQTLNFGSMFSIAEHLIKSTDIFSCAVSFFASSVMRGNAFQGFIPAEYRGRCSAHDVSENTLLFLNGVADVTLPGANTTAIFSCLGETILAIPCSSITLSSAQLLRLFCINQASAMHAFHYSKFTSSLFFLLFLVIEHSHLCVGLILGDVLAALVSTSAKYIVSVIRRSIKFIMDFQINEGGESDIKRSMCPVTASIEACFCPSQVSCLLILNRMLGLVLQVFEKLSDDSSISKAVSQETLFAEIPAFRAAMLYIIDLIANIFMHVNSKWPIGFRSILGTTLKCYTFLNNCATSFPKNVSFFVNLSDYEAITTLLAVLSSNGVMLRAMRTRYRTVVGEVDLFQSTVTLLRSILRRTMCSTDACIYSPDGCLSTLVFMNVASSRSLHKALFKCWISCHHISSSIEIDGTTQLSYATVLSSLFCYNNGMRTADSIKLYRTRIAELLCEFSVSLLSVSASDIDMFTLLSRWVNHRKGGLSLSHQLDEIYFIKFFVYIALTTEPVLWLESLDDAFWSPIFTVFSDANLIFAVETISMRDIASYFTTDDGKFVIKNGPVATNMSHLLDLCRPQEVSPHVFVLAMLFGKLTLIEEKLCAAVNKNFRQDLVLFLQSLSNGEDSSMLSPLLNAILLQFVKVISSKSITMSSYLRDRLRIDYSEDIIDQHIVFLRIYIAAMCSLLLPCLTFRKGGIDAAYLLTEFASLGCAEVEIFKLGCISAITVDIFEDLLYLTWYSLLWFRDYSTSLDYSIRAINHRDLTKANNARLFSLLWLWLKSSHSAFFILSDLPQLWSNCFVLLILTVAKFDIIVQENDEYLAYNVTPQYSEVFLFEKILNWYFSIGITSASIRGNSCTLACIFHIRKSIRNSSDDSMISINSFGGCNNNVGEIILRSILCPIQTMHFFMCSTNETASGRIFLVNCISSLLVLAMSLRFCQLREPVFAPILIKTIFVRCLEIVVAVTHADILIQRIDVDISKSWECNFMSNFQCLSSQDQLIVLLKFSAIKVCIIVLEVAVDDEMSLEMEGWNDDIQDHLLSSSIWSHFAETCEFQKALQRYRSRHGTAVDGVNTCKAPAFPRRNIPAVTRDIFEWLIDQCQSSICEQHAECNIRSSGKNQISQGESTASFVDQFLLFLLIKIYSNLL